MAITSKLEENLESIQAAQIIVDSSDKLARGTTYSPAYKDAVFTIWYSSGKIPVYKLIQKLPNPIDFGITHGYPSEGTVRLWINNDFFERAAVLDEEVGRQLADRLIAEKVKMLVSHAVIAEEMQDMALAYLRDNAEKLSPNSAVRLLVEGVRIERESKGIPRTLEKLADKSDEDLLAQIEDMILRSPTTSSVEDIDD